MRRCEPLKSGLSSDMRNSKSIVLLVFTGILLSNIAGASAATKVTKPSAPVVSVISSTAGSSGKTNLKITIVLPTTNGG